MKLNIKELVTFAMLGAMMFSTKKVMEFLPEIHLLGTFIVAATVVYRQKALYPISIYIFLEGLFLGIGVGWIPYLYIWTVLWGMVMLLPKKLPKKWQAPVYMAVSGLHGFLFGLLYSPMQALFFGMDFRSTLTWIAVGFVTADIRHGISNIVCGLLICPLIAIMNTVNRRRFL